MSYDLIPILDSIPPEIATVIFFIVTMYIVQIITRVLLTWAGESEMGYVPAEAPVQLNLDKFGLPKDYATYVWLLYKKRVNDDSPNRRAFLNKGEGFEHPDFGLQYSYF